MKIMIYVSNMLLRESQIHSVVCLWLI